VTTVNCALEEHLLTYLLTYFEVVCQYDEDAVLVITCDFRDEFEDQSQMCTL